jgi:hypothetical protein
MSLTKLKDAVKHPPHSEQDKSELINSDNLTSSEPMEVDNPVDNITSEVSIQYEQRTTVKHSPPGVEQLLRTLRMKQCPRLKELKNQLPSLLRILL